MTIEQIRRKEMHEAVSAYMDTHVEKWSSITKVTEYKNALDEINTAIEEAQESQNESQVFLGRNKTALKQLIAHKSDIINDLVEAYAGEVGDLTLLNRMEDSYSDLNKLRNEDFIVKIREIIREAESRVAELAAYGLIEGQITDLKADMDNFLQLHGQPRQYRIASRQATQDLDSLFKAAGDLLSNKLDKVMTTFRRRDTTFYNGYLAARTIT